MIPQSSGARRRAWVAALASVVGVALASACGSSDHAPTLAGADVICVDNDGDGFGPGCWAGKDCDDSNPKVTCGNVSPCDANPYAPGCSCPADGTTHDCGKVSTRSGDYVTCGLGSVRCSGGAWTDCSIDSKRSGLLSMQRLLALGGAAPCLNNPCDPSCQHFLDLPHPTVLTDAGRGDPNGKFFFPDGGMSLGPKEAGSTVGPFPDGAPPPPPWSRPRRRNLVVTTMNCTAAVEAGGTLSCAVTLQNNGGTWATTFTNDLRLSTDATIDGTDVLLDYCGVSSLGAGGTVNLTCSGTVPAGTAPGAYYAGFIVDSGTTIPETDETNNTASAAVTIAAATVPTPPVLTPPDLVVTSLANCTTPANQSGTLSCDVTVKNQGGSWASAFDVDVRLSVDPTMDPLDTFIARCGVAQLDVGSSTTITCSGTVPAVTPAGAYTLGAIADPLNTVAESDETNNTATMGETVTAAPASPDLIVSSVTCAPSPVGAGTYLNCAVGLKNQGLNYASGFAVDLRLSSTATLSGASIGNCTSAGILAGGTATINCAGAIPGAQAAGAYYAVANADPGNAVTESNETNNWTASAVTVTAAVAQRPDLAVDGVTCFGSGVSPALDSGASMPCTFNVRNQGTSTATNFITKLVLANNPTGASGVPLTGASCGPAVTLGPVSSTVVSCVGSIPAGTADGLYYVVAIVDSTSIIAESDEANNTAFSFVSVPQFSHNIVLLPGDSAGPLSAPNTIFTGLSCGIGSFLGFSIVDADDSTDFDGPPGTAPYLTPANCDEGSGGVCNDSLGVPIPGRAGGSNGCGFLGGGKCDAMFIKKLTGSFLSTPAVTYTVPSAFPRQCYNQVFRFSVEAFLGCDLPATITIPGDPAKCPTLPGGPTTKPDIVATGVTCGAATAGGTLTCSFTLKNTGIVDSVPFTNAVTTTIPGMAAMACPLANGLAAGATTSVQCTGVVPAAAAAGSFNVTATADSGAAVVESSEANNAVTVTGAIAVSLPPLVPGVADLVVTSMTCPSIVAQGDTLTCTLVITNAGGDGAAAFDDQLRLSTDATIDTTDTLLGTCGVPSLAAGASATVKCSGPISTGVATTNWFAGIIVDEANAVVESDETNNTGSAATTFTVTAAPTAPPTSPADIQVTSITCTPPNVAQGGTLSCDVKLVNAGGSVALTFDDELRLSSDTAIDTTDTLLGNCGVSGLGVGATITVKCSGMVPASTTTGPWFAGIVADSTNAIPEGIPGELNDTSSTAVTIDAPASPPASSADIVVASVDCPTSVDPGGSLTCTVTLRNQGGTDAPAFSNDLYVSVDRTIDATDALLGPCPAPAIPAGGTTTITCTGTLSAGATRDDYMFAGVIADSNNDVPEATETNNTSYDPFLVAPPPPAYGTTWYERDYDGSTLCPKNEDPVWGLFYWETKTPGDSSITFSVLGATSKAGLDSAPSSTMAVAARATSSTPPGSGGGIYPLIPGTGDTQADSVVVNDVLIGANQPLNVSWLRVHMDFAPATNGSAPPSLGLWDLQVGCQSSR